MTKTFLSGFFSCVDLFDFFTYANRFGNVKGRRIKTVFLQPVILLSFLNGRKLSYLIATQFILHETGLGRFMLLKYRLVF